MGARPAGCSLERTDNDGHYEPSNCRWGTRVEQARNTSRNVLVELGGVTRAFAEWCEIYRINVKTARKRAQLGWDYPAVFTTPVRR